MNYPEHIMRIWGRWSQVPAPDARASLLLLLCTVVLLFDLFVSPLGEGVGVPSETTVYQLVFKAPDALVLDSHGIDDEGLKSLAMPPQYGALFFLPVPINSSPKDVLMTVKGVGPVLADEIIGYRQQFGPFKWAGDLINLDGVGPKRAENLEPFFSFTQTP